MYDDLDDYCFCQLCEGPLLELGALGNLTHLQCRDCGIQFSETTTPTEYAGGHDE